jgi:DNA-binding response OmpR family regulator
MSLVSCQDYAGPCGNSILVIEDDEDLLELYQVALVDEGYTALIARTAEAGLRILQQSEPLPRLIILDGRLPEMDGKDLIGEIRSQLGAASQIPIVFISAEGELAAALQSQVSYFLPKPLDFEDFLNAIRLLVPL